MNVTDFIFQLFHIVNFPLLVVPTPPHSPCTPSVDYVHSFINYVNLSADCDHTFANYIDFFVDYVNKYDDSANTHDD
jgi:hypothetical protein